MWLWPCLACMRGVFLSQSWPWVQWSYQYIVLRHRNVAGVDRQPHTLPHLRGKPAWLPGSLTALLPGAPEKEEIQDSGRLLGPIRGPPNPHHQPLPECTQLPAPHPTFPSPSPPAIPTKSPHSFAESPGSF